MIVRGLGEEVRGLTRSSVLLSQYVLAHSPPSQFRTMHILQEIIALSGVFLSFVITYLLLSFVSFNLLVDHLVICVDLL